MEMEGYTNFTIHFSIISKMEYDQDTKQDLADCYGSGKYCVYPESLDISDGRIILNEILNQKCIFNYANEKEKIKLYFEYMIHFNEECIMKRNFNAACSLEAMDLAGISPKDINECVYNSFDASQKERETLGYKAKVPNKLLDEEIDARQEHFIMKLPTMLINNRLYLGNLRADYIFEALCSGFLTKPDICRGEIGYHEDKTSTITIVIVILIIIVVNVVIFFICAKYINKKIKQRIDSSNLESKIDTVVNSYLKLRESNTNAASS